MPGVIFLRCFALKHGVLFTKVLPIRCIGFKVILVQDMNEGLHIFLLLLSNYSQTGVISLKSCSHEVQYSSGTSPREVEYSSAYSKNVFFTILIAICNIKVFLILCYTHLFLN